MLSAAAPLLAQVDGHSLSAIEEALDGIAPLEKAPAARCGLEQALLDLLARREGVPLRRLLNPDALGEIAVSALLTKREPQALAEEALGLVAAGFESFKLKVAGCPLAEDVARLEALRTALGAAPRVRIDANGGWTEARAREALRALAPFALELCEQPVAPGEPAAWSRLRELGIPLAADESVPFADELRALLAARALDAVVLKPQVLGGLLRALRIAGLARASGAAPYVTTSLEGRIGRAGAAELAAALGDTRFAHGLETGRLLAEDLSLLPRNGAAGFTAVVAVEPTERAQQGGRWQLSPAPGLDVERPSPITAAGVECAIARQARERPAAPALYWRGGAVSYLEFDRLVRRFSGGLRALGVHPGDRVALLADASPEAAALCFAAARVGAPLALLNTRLTARELAPQLARISPRLFLATAALLERLPGAIGLEAFAAGAGPLEETSGSLAPSRVQTLIFTSGTTGQPKAVQLTAGAHLASARAAKALLQLDSTTRWLCTLPLFHVGGLAILQRCALVGGAAVLHERFDAAAAAGAVASGQVTHASLVATTLQRLLDASSAAAPESLRAFLVGGGPTPAHLLRRARAAGFPVLQTYGLTEAGSHVTCERPGDADGQTAGAPIPGTELRVVDEERRPLGPGVIGSIEVRGPTLMAGYLDDQGATAAALSEGWLRTGDLGATNKQSRLFVSARRSDLVITGGENVYPAEVEAALLEHPAVAEAAVFGRRDEIWGQAVVAAVVLRTEGDEPALREFLRGRIAPFKVPREVLVVGSLPRTAAGKLDRSALPGLLKR